MRFEDFLKELEDAGWQGVGDAQHENIKHLWKKIYPVIAELEQEVFELECIAYPYSDIKE